MNLYIFVGNFHFQLAGCRDAGTRSLLDPSRGDQHIRYSLLLWTTTTTTTKAAIIMQDRRGIEVLVDMTNQQAKRKSTGISTKPGIRYQDNENILNGSVINGADVDGSHFVAPPLAQENLQSPKANGVVYHQNMYSRDGERDPRPYLQRRSSSPMMPAFMVSAPGKVIVFGEHAVVHGKVRFMPYIDSRFVC